MVKISRQALPPDLQCLLNQWQRAVNTNDINLIAPKHLSKTVKARLAAWQTAIDNQHSVGDLPWQAFNLLEKESANRLRNILVEQFHGKCAYCEMRSEFEIDHFHPKSPHPRLNANQGSPVYMFVWENLLLSCKICNGFAYKGASMAWDNGQPRLLNPCQDEPLAYLSITLDSDVVANMGWMQPALPQTPVGKTRAEYTIRKLGLNKRDYLRQGRADRINDFIDWLEMLFRPQFGPDFKMRSGKTIRERFLKMLHPSEPFLAAIRQFLHENPEVRLALLEQIPQLRPHYQWLLLPIK